MGFLLGLVAGGFTIGGTDIVKTDNTANPGYHGGIFLLLATHNIWWLLGGEAFLNIFETQMDLLCIGFYSE